MNPGYYSPHPA